MDIAEYGLTEHDLSFLKEKLDNAELITVHGNRTTTGEITSYTPATGYTFYHIKSLITNTGSVNTNSSLFVTISVSVKNDTTTIDTIGGTDAGDYQDSSGFGHSSTPNRRNYSDIPAKLIGNSTKKFSLNCDTITTGTIYGTIIGYIEAS